MPHSVLGSSAIPSDATDHALHPFPILHRSSPDKSMRGETAQYFKLPSPQRKLATGCGAKVQSDTAVQRGCSSASASELRLAFHARSGARTTLQSRALATTANQPVEPSVPPLKPGLPAHRVEITPERLPVSIKRSAGARPPEPLVGKPNRVVGCPFNSLERALEKTTRMRLKTVR